MAATTSATEYADLPFELRVMIAEADPMAWLRLAQVDRQFLAYTRRPGVKEREADKYIQIVKFQVAWGVRRIRVTRGSHRVVKELAPELGYNRNNPTIMPLYLRDNPPIEVEGDDYSNAIKHLRENVSNAPREQTIIRPPVTAFTRTWDYIRDIKFIDATYARLEFNGHPITCPTIQGVVCYPDIICLVACTFIHVAVESDARELRFTSGYLPLVEQYKFTRHKVYTDNVLYDIGAMPVANAVCVPWRVSPGDIVELPK